MTPKTTRTLRSHQGKMPLLKIAERRLKRKERDEELGLDVIKAKMREAGEMSGGETDSDESDSEDGSDDEAEDEDEDEDDDDDDEQGEGDEDEDGEEDDEEEDGLDGSDGMFSAKKAARQTSKHEPS